MARNHILYRRIMRGKQMAPNYLGQRELLCGPIAVYNALVWAGADITPDQLKKISKDAGATPLTGAQEEDVKYALRLWGTKYFSIEESWSYPRIGTVEHHIKNGGAILLFYAYGKRKERLRHATLLVDTSDNGERFTAINFHIGRTIYLGTRAELRYVLRKRKTGGTGNTNIGWDPRAVYLTKLSAAPKRGGFILYFCRHPCIVANSIRETKTKREVAMTARKTPGLGRDEEIKIFYEYGVYIATRKIVIGSVHTDIDGNESGVDSTMWDRIEKGLEILETWPLSAEQDNTITIVMNNPGGDEYHMFAIYNRIRASPCRIVMEASGHIMSAGSIIFQAADVRKMHEDATMMVHNGTSSFSGNPKDLERFTAEGKRILARMVDIYLEKIRQKHPKFSEAKMKRMLEFDSWIPASEAVELGLADEIISYPEQSPPRA